MQASEAVGCGRVVGGLWSANGASAAACARQRGDRIVRHVRFWPIADIKTSTHCALKSAIASSRVKFIPKVASYNCNCPKHHTALRSIRVLGDSHGIQTGPPVFESCSMSKTKLWRGRLDMFEVRKQMAQFDTRRRLVAVFLSRVQETCETRERTTPSRYQASDPATAL